MVGAKGDARPSIKRYLSEVGYLVPRTLGLRTMLESNRTSKNEMRVLFPGASSFDTPKPERASSTRSGYFNEFPATSSSTSFAGSGTTGAVAHKMGRRWIMVELGEHCHTHIIPRLKKVIDGEDQGGITEAVGWQGGGGFRYFKLAPSLLEKDNWGSWVISKDYNAAMLAEALCKLEGFTYAPERRRLLAARPFDRARFHLCDDADARREQLAAIERGGRLRTLVARAVLGVPGQARTDSEPHRQEDPERTCWLRCEWGHDDYSLNIENLPKAPPKPEPDVASPDKATKQPDLFGAKNGASR